MPRSSKCSLLFRFCSQNFICIYNLLFVLHASFSLIYCFNNIMSYKYKLLILSAVSPLTCCPAVHVLHTTTATVKPLPSVKIWSAAP
jgi:hypothetical protein